MRFLRYSLGSNTSCHRYQTCGMPCTEVCRCKSSGGSIISALRALNGIPAVEGRGLPDLHREAGDCVLERETSTIWHHGITRDMRLGIADHLGWAVAVTASADHEVVDRRRIELVEPAMTVAPIHYEGWRLDVATTAALVAKVRASVVRTTSAALDEIVERAARACRVDLAVSLIAGLPRRHRRPTSGAI